MKITKRTRIALIVLIAMLLGIIAFIKTNDRNNQEVTETLANTKPANKIEKAQIIKEDSDKILALAVDSIQEGPIASNLVDTVIAIAALKALQMNSLLLKTYVLKLLVLVQECSLLSK